MKEFIWKNQIWRQSCSDSNLDLTPLLVTNRPKQERKLLLRLGKRRELWWWKVGAVAIVALLLGLLLLANYALALKRENDAAEVQIAAALALLAQEAARMEGAA